MQWRGATQESDQARRSRCLSDFTVFRQAGPLRGEEHGPSVTQRRDLLTILGE